MKDQDILDQIQKRMQEYIPNRRFVVTTFEDAEKFNADNIYK